MRKLISSKMWITLLTGALLLLLLPGWRTLHGLLHPDHGKRHIVYPFGAEFSIPHVVGHHVLLGTTDGYVVFPVNVKNIKSPKFMEGIPAMGTLSGQPVFYRSFGYYPTWFGLFVVNMLPQSIFFCEMIPFPDTPRIVRVQEQRRKLYILADNGMRIYDISVPSRPILVSFDRSVHSSEPGKNPTATIAFCPLPDGRIARTVANAPSVVLFSDGKKIVVPGKVQELFEEDGNIRILTTDKQLLNDRGVVLQKGVEHYQIEKNIASWIRKKGNVSTFCQETEGKEKDWDIPQELNGCRKIHAADGIFAAIWQGDVYFGTLNDQTRKLEIKSSVPVIMRNNEPLAMGSSLAYGIIEKEGSFIIHGIQYRNPPYDGTPYDFLYSYPSEYAKKSGKLTARSLACVKNYIVAPDMLLKKDVFGTKPIRPLGPPPTSVCCNAEETRLLMTYDAASGKGIGAVLYDISELPEMKKIAEIKDETGFVDALFEKDNIWLLSANGTVTCYNITAQKKFSGNSEKDTAYRTCCFVRIGSLLYVFPAPDSVSKNLKIMDIRDSEKPYLLKEIPDLLPEGTRDVASAKNAVFTAGSQIRCFDVSNPVNPILKDLFYGPDVRENPYISVEVKGKTLIGKKQGSFDVWDNWEKGNSNE